ncbi:MAG TPA: hypothetical protein VGC96_07675 [Candidatus Elarobacter sp.]|jgi:hypothetical protein
MLPRRLTVAALAALFAASASAAMLQNPKPALADPAHRWARHERHQRFDRDDRGRYGRASYANSAYYGNRSYGNPYSVNPYYGNPYYATPYYGRYNGNPNGWNARRTPHDRDRDDRKPHYTPWRDRR